MSQGDLLVNARGEPGLAQILQTEIASADRIDLLCAFIKWNGLRLLEAVLRQHLEQRRALRVITTTYIGATERRAIDLLAGLGAEVKVSYDTRTTRLHAKAWYFHRESGFSTAYVGSSNLSHAALLEGLEWNVRLSQVETPDVLDKFRATFDGYWEGSEFEDYDARTRRREVRRGTRASAREGNNRRCSPASSCVLTLSRSRSSTSSGPSASATDAIATWWSPPPAPARPSSPRFDYRRSPRTADRRGCCSSRTARRS